MPSHLPPFSQEQKLDKSELLSGFQTYFLPRSFWPIFYPFSLLPYLISPPFSHGRLWGGDEGKGEGATVQCFGADS